MASKNATLYIDINQPNNRGDFVIQVIDPQNNKTICTNKLPENQNNLQYLYATSLIERPQSALTQGDMQTASQRQKSRERYDDLVRYGKRLYQDLFGDGKALQRHIKRNEHLQGELKFILRLHNDASELWNIPWEYAHDGESLLFMEGGHRILRQPRTIVEQYQLPPPKPVALPLRILVIISDPLDASPLNIDHEIRIIQDALRPAEEKGMVVLDIVEEGTLFNLDIMLNENAYHILHYTGHGAMTNEGSCLVMEDAQGHATPVFVDEFLPYLTPQESLQLVVLSGCQTGQVQETQAMSGIATGLLELVPAVVSMQFSILDTSAQIFAKMFYGAIAQGRTLDDALFLARKAMDKAQHRVADWGVPSLYAHHESVRLLNPKDTPPSPTKAPDYDLSALPATTIFSGRRNALRTLRHMLPDLNKKMVYLWGLGGMGKSALARRIIERPGRTNLITSALVLRADTTPPNEMLRQIAEWLGGYFPEVMTIMSNAQASPAQRIHAVGDIVQGKRFVLVIDRFDALLKQTPDRQWGIPNPALAQFFEQLAKADWSVLTIFTSRYRWRMLPQLPEGTYEEIHLGALNIPETMFFLQQVPAMQRAKPAHLSALTNQVGGHPASLMIASQLVMQKKNPALLASREFTVYLLKQAQQNFMADALNQLTPTERNALGRTCILGDYFSPEEVQRIANLESEDQAILCMARWEALSLANFLATDDRDTPYYRIPNIVNTYLLRQIKPNALPALHQQVVDVILDMSYKQAEYHFLEYGGTEPNPDDPFTTVIHEWQSIIESGQPQLVSHYVQMGLRLRQHLLKAGDIHHAEDIGYKWWHFLAHKMHDRKGAMQLLEETHASVKEPYDKALARMYMAELMIDDGKYKRALRMIEGVDEELAKRNHTSNRVRLRRSQAWVYDTMGKTKDAKKLRVEALEMAMKHELWEDAAQFYVDLGEKARTDQDYKNALSYADKAVTLAKRHTSISYLTAGNIFYLQGGILRMMNQLQPAMDSYNNALQYYQQGNYATDTASTLESMARVLWQAKRDSEAARFILQAIDITKQIDDINGLPSKLLLWSIILEEQGEVADALVQAQRALELATDLGNSELIEDIKPIIKRQKRNAR